MNAELEKMLTDYVVLAQREPAILGAWKFGSISRGMDDALSDIDLVLLIDGSCFSQADDLTESILERVCESIILRWEEDFNSGAVHNNGYLIQTPSSLSHFDLFLLNQDQIDDPMCRIHYTGLKEEHILFDRHEAVKGLCNISPAGKLWQADRNRLVRTYLYHFAMSAKYLLRQDYFKLYSVLHTLYEAHASLLLTEYDAIPWGGPQNKLHYIPLEKQAHLKRYVCLENFTQVRENLRQSLAWFRTDTAELGEPVDTIDIVRDFWLCLLR